MKGQKLFHKFIAVTSVALAGVLAVSTIRESVLKVSAENTLYGIETLVRKIQESNQPYRILEVVSDEQAAEIGYFIPGYEPILSTRNEENGQWESWQKGLQQLNSEQERKEYIDNLKANLDSFYQKKGFTASTAPVVYEDYKESSEPKEGYQELQMSTKTRKGYFVAAAGTETDRYNLEFAYVGSASDESINQYDNQYYYAEQAQAVNVNMYDSISDDTSIFRLVQVGLDSERFEYVGLWKDIKKTITISSGNSEGESNNDENSNNSDNASLGANGVVTESVSAGDNSVATYDNQLQEDNLTSTYDNQLQGGNLVTTYDAELQDCYLVTFAKWTPGLSTTYSGLYRVNSCAPNVLGEYTFIETEDGQEFSFSTDKVYYKGGFVNQEWFRKSVLNLEDNQLSSFPIEVVTLTTGELNQLTEQDAFPEFDFLYLNGNIAYTLENDITEVVQAKLFQNTIASGKPCLVDASLVYKLDDSKQIVLNDAMKDKNIFYLAALFMQNSPQESYTDYGTTNKKTIDELLETVKEDADKNFVTEQVYCFFQPQTLISENFERPTIHQNGSGAEAEEGFQEVLDEINSENLNREADGTAEYQPLSTNISQATVLRHIVNYQYRRNIEVKNDIRVLEIEPTKAKTYGTETSYDLTEDEIRKWAFGSDTEAAKDVNITIDRWTTAEFIGHIEDLNENYDLIYIGTDRDYLNTSTDSLEYDSRYVGSTVFNDSSMNGLIYFHTGDLRYTSMELAGQLDTEHIYVNGNKTEDVYYYNPVRYSGNDITIEKKNALKNFLAASYPVIVSNEFFNSAASIYTDSNFMGNSFDLDVGDYNVADLHKMGIGNDTISSLKVRKGYKLTAFWDSDYAGNTLVYEATAGDIEISLLQDGWNDAISSIKVETIPEVQPERTINTDHIDNSSYLYDFVVDAMSQSNFYARKDITDDSGQFKFYLNRPKVSLTNVSANGDVDANGVYYITKNEEGRYLLKYRFTINNQGVASVNTRYKCQLYVDVNADGKYSESEELGDVTIKLAGTDNNIAYDALYAGKEYELTRYVPDGYKGVLPWKLQVTQVSNFNIHSGVEGYTKLKGLSKETLKILQICRDQVTEKDWWGGANEVLFNLEDKLADPNDIYHILVYGGTYGDVYYPGISNDFDLDVKFMKISQFEKAYQENSDILSNYNMLILGFSDAYGELSNAPVEAIQQFIESGKSVLFAHDTVSYFNYQKGVNGVINRDTGETDVSDQYHNSYNLSHHIRGLVGMDRYGMTMGDKNENILTTGQNLSETNVEEWKRLLQVTNSKKDFAYVPKTNKTQTYGLTQGYTYSLINVKDFLAGKDQGKRNGEAGFVVGDNTYFTKEQTGLENIFTNTYRNLNFGDVYYYTDDRHDNGDNRVSMNTQGEVENLWVTKVNSGQITEYPYRLADEFQVSRTHAQYYQLDFNADDDQDGQSDLVVWYCLGYQKVGDNMRETIYSASPNDVSNNYYIYNKGNITYTGVGHAGNTSTVEEAKLFINTMIASYNAGIKDPEISVLSDGTRNAREIQSLNRYMDEENNLEFNQAGIEKSELDQFEKIYFTANDLNFVKGTREIAVNCYYEATGEGTQTIPYQGKNFTVKKIPQIPINNELTTGVIYEASTNKAVDANKLQSGGIYYIYVDKNTIKSGGQRFSLYFEAQSTIQTYNKVLTTGKSYNRFDIIKVKLFDLE